MQQSSTHSVSDGDAEPENDPETRCVMTVVTRLLVANECGSFTARTELHAETGVISDTQKMMVVMILENMF